MKNTYLNCLAFLCPYTCDKGLFLSNVFEGFTKNYNVWYKRSGYDWGSTGHYYRPAVFGPVPATATDEVLVGPNPTSGAITVQAEGRYMITDVPGRQMQQGDLYAGKHDIDVRQLPAGNYIVTFGKEGAQPVKRKFTKF
jgi:hypothetical protein